MTKEELAEQERLEQERLAAEGQEEGTEEYDDLWNEAEGETKPAEKEEEKDEKVEQEAGEKPELPEKASEMSPEVLALLENKDVSEETRKVIREHGDINSIVKALSDTKTSYGQLQTKVAESEKSALKVAETTQVAELTEKLNATLSEYDPALVAAFSPLLDDFAKLKQQVSESATAKTETDKLAASQNKFITETVPKLSKENQVDCVEIFKDSAYMDWATKQTPAMQFAAMQSEDPSDIDSALDSFKLYRATPEAKVLLEKKMKDREKKLGMNQTITQSESPPLMQEEAASSVSYEAEWEKQEKERLGVPK